MRTHVTEIFMKHFIDRRSNRVAPLRLGLSLSLVCAGCVVAVHAGNVFVETSTGQFGTLNPLTGSYSLIGNTTFANAPVTLGGLGYGPGGNLYGLDSSGSLYLVNVANAHLTQVGSTGLSLTAFWSFGGTSDGALYANWQKQLYSVNPATGAASPVGSGIGYYSDGGMNGDASGHLYLVKYANLGGAINGFSKVNRTTGEGTAVGDPNDDFQAAFGLAYTGGAMYAINDLGKIFQVNLADGSTTLSSTYDVATVGNVYAAAAQWTTVPEPASAALVAGIGLGAFALLRRRSS